MEDHRNITVNGYQPFAHSKGNTMNPKDPYDANRPSVISAPPGITRAGDVTRYDLNEAALAFGDARVKVEQASMDLLRLQNEAKQAQKAFDAARVGLDGAGRRLNQYAQRLVQGR